MSPIALSELLGRPVIDASGAVSGSVREVALAPQDDPTHVAALIVRTHEGDRMLPSSQVAEFEPMQVRAAVAASVLHPVTSTEGLLLLERDLLDQQIIDVHGRKVVRVNDVELHEEKKNGSLLLRVAEVDVGLRGAIRRLLRGIVPRKAIGALVGQLPARVIPWEFVDLIETDPARRVRLKISHERLARLHPADIADIVEELAPAEREAVFETLDEEVAAEALEELNPKMQASIVEALDSERAADIVEEMDPDAAADLLGGLPHETSEEILKEMEEEEREDVAELLEFKEETAGGRMTTDYIALPPTAAVAEAIDALRHFEGGDVETVSNILLVDAHGKLMGAVPLSRIALAEPEVLLSSLRAEPLISCHAGAQEKEVAELFDKYNLLTLPVVDKQGLLTGVITADDVISLLRRKL